MVQVVNPTSSIVKKVDEVIVPPKGTPHDVVGCSKTVGEINSLIDDIIRSKEVTTCEFVGNVLNHEEEVHNIFVAAGHHVQPLQVVDYVLAEKQWVVQHHSSLE
jgi:low affinity Fe/Cu permease